jgi:hypothetical protein
VALLTTFANIQLEKANCGIIADEERVGGWGLNQLEVVFCGDSVYLSGLAASLRPNPRLRVTQLDAPVADLAARIILAGSPGPATRKD